ncbi:MAG: PEP-CTERM sorting domain-containing protein, partial [Desulfobacterales bacterium]|nr:PEP-CTERM sorting domain-containing protein [Desulfobacterales bacterium]
VGVWFYKSTAVPEPSTAILFGLGILAITGRKRQRVT